MKVVIEIHDGEVTAAVPRPGVVAAETVATEGAPPPAELLAAAAAVGAANAGPAPTAPMASGAPVAPTPAAAEQPPAGEADDVAAGAAPDTPPDPGYS
jgi:hypothetical protein